MNEPILSIKDLKVHYGGIEAVKGISFDVDEGSIVTLIGAKEAAKNGLYNFELPTLGHTFWLVTPNFTITKAE